MTTRTCPSHGDVVGVVRHHQTIVGECIFHDTSGSSFRLKTREKCFETVQVGSDSFEVVSASQMAAIKGEIFDIIDVWREIGFDDFDPGSRFDGQSLLRIRMALESDQPLLAAPLPFDERLLMLAKDAMQLVLGEARAAASWQIVYQALFG